jgi:hypothetical protein
MVEVTGLHRPSLDGGYGMDGSIAPTFLTTDSISNERQADLVVSR